MVDTACDVSIIKKTFVDILNINNFNYVNLYGIVDKPYRTLGSVELDLKLGRNKFNNEFQVVGEDFPIPSDGILGKDFLEKTKAVIDFNQNVLVVKDVSIGFENHTNKTLITARSEQVIKVDVNKNTLGFLNQKNLDEGILLGNCLVEPKNFQCLVVVMNITEEDKWIEIPRLELEEISEKIFEVEGSVEARNIYHVRCASSTDRCKELENNLRLEHLNTEEYSDIVNLCNLFNDVFLLKGDKLKGGSKMKHAITLTDQKPIFQRQYKTPFGLREELNKQIETLLENDVIEKSCSPWNAPVLLVPKKEDASGRKKWRVVVDFRKINEKTIHDTFPIPVINEILDQLGSAKYFSTLDLASGFFQLDLEECDKEKTAFSTHEGKFQYRKMPMGLKNSPATFQRMMNSVLAGLTAIKCLVYLDDIVVWGSSLEEHNIRLKEVLQRLRENNLQVQPDKCEFLRKEVNFLGHVISEHGVLPDQKKIEAVRNFPVPLSKSDVQSFNGLTGYYRRFVKDFARVAAPLTRLTGKVDFVWGEKEQIAFETLRDKVTTAPILQYPDFSKPYILTTDASGIGLGAVLSQGVVGKDKPIAFASRKLNPAEKNYSTIERELLAIVYGLKNFRQYLYGQKVFIYTDHKPLVHLANIKESSGRLLNWRLEIQDYDYEIFYKKGSWNTNADALSRIFIVTENGGIKLPELVVPSQDNSSQEVVDDAWEQELTQSDEPTDEEKMILLAENHSSPIAGHRGVNATIKRIKEIRKWYGMTTEIKEFVRRCPECQSFRLMKKGRAPMIITDTPKMAMEKVCLDIVGPMPITNNGNSYILTFQDALSKFVQCIPVDKIDAETVARKFVENIVTKFGLPDVILTDQGSNFTSKMFSSMCKMFKVDKIQTSAYHPESNGSLERYHLELKGYLRNFIKADQKDWDEWLDLASYSYNNTVHSATRITPHELMFGRKPNIPSSLTKPASPFYAYGDYLKELQEKMRRTNEIARENLQSAKELSKENFDKKAKEISFKVGDKVLLKSEEVRRHRTKKLGPQTLGPYEVVEKVSDVSYIIKMGRKSITVHVNRLKSFYS